MSIKERMGGLDLTPRAGRGLYFDPNEPTAEPDDNEDDYPMSQYVEDTIDRLLIRIEQTWNNPQEKDEEE